MIENFDLFLNNQSQIQLRPSITSTTPNNPINQLPTYQWTGKIAFDGVIPLIDLEKKEIRSFVYIASKFFQSNNILGERSISYKNLIFDR